MTVYKTLLLLLVVAMMSGGQILFKKAALQIQSQHPILLVLGHLFSNPYMIAGIVLYGLTTLLWVFILKDTQLSKAYPFMAINFFLVPLASTVFFNEPITLGVCAGTALIIFGLLTIYTI